ncbi:galanin receptor 2a-like [Antedon mediterranea]|uniref:galanin receptor 2a-like n=1 Tax=Antedon mediterranea TaxID=105859 RepID=UPI003AF731B9
MDITTVAMETDNDENSSSYVEYFDPDQHIYDRLKIFSIILYFIIFIIGMFGNCSVFLTIACNRSMRQGKKAPNILLAGLALSDCIYLMVNTPFRLAADMFKEDVGNKSEFVCGLTVSIAVFSQAISVYSLAILSCDRYKAILSPLQHRQWQTAKIYYSMLAVSWSLGLAFAFASGYLSHLGENPYNGKKYCEASDTYTAQAKIFEINKAIFLFVIPMCIIAFCYISISHHLCSTGRLVKNETENKKINKQRNRLAAIIALMALAFFVCWFPYVLWFLLHQYEVGLFTFGAAVSLIVIPVLACANSCINPVIIYLISREFRSYICGYRIGHHKGAATPSTVGSSKFVRLSRGSTVVSSWKSLTGRNKSRNCKETEQIHMTSKSILKPDGADITY